jgi:hypothetical protein
MSRSVYPIVRLGSAAYPGNGKAAERTNCHCAAGAVQPGLLIYDGLRVDEVFRILVIHEPVIFSMPKAIERRQDDQRQQRRSR